MINEIPEYEVFALRYATSAARRADHFIGGDPHDGPMPMDYFVWAVTVSDRVFLVDTGFTAETAAGANASSYAVPSRACARSVLNPTQLLT